MLIFILAVAAAAAENWKFDRACHDGTDLMQRTSRMTRSASNLDAILEGHEFASGCSNLQISEVPALVAHPLRNITWLHFPKAGTSFLATIWNYACGRRTPLDLAVSPKAVPDCDRCYDFALMDRYPAHDYCEEGFLAAHFTTQHRPVKKSSVKLQQQQVVGMFRRPSQRLMSAFHDSLHAAGFEADEFNSLWQECRNSPSCFARFPGIAGCMSRMLTGSSCAESHQNRSSFDGGKAHLEEALSMVKEMTFVGLTEHWDLSICLFQRMFGGTVNAMQLLDYHKGGSHQNEPYDESQLMGFVDEVDESIYRAASERFQELLETYISPDHSECTALVQSAKRLEDRTETVEKSCSCAVAGRECGFSSSLGMSCGKCPKKRMRFKGATEDQIHRLNVTCDEEHGSCLVEGNLQPDVFKWTL